MIGYTVKKLLMDKADTFVIPAQNVANVSACNPLYHAMLVLTQVKFSMIPVLEDGDKYVGLVGLGNVMEKIFEVSPESIDPENLKDYTVQDVIVEAPSITVDWTIEEVLHLLVDYAFIPVVEEDGTFVGILTRKQMLKAVNYMAHVLESQNHVLPKECAAADSEEKARIVIG